MQQVITIIFWTSWALLLYGYIGYGVILSIINRFKKAESVPYHPYYPSVAFLVAAYNEEDIIEQKILNTLSLNYPQDKINFYYITDGSNDNTHNICLKYDKIRTLHIDQRIGKLASLQRVIPTLLEDIILFSDANCMINDDGLLYLLPHFNDPDIGAVSGEKKVRGGADAAASEGLYWKYESWLKSQDSRFYSLVGAAGELFCVRRKLYTILPDNLILDDFVQSMKVCEQGYKVLYEKQAYSIESASFDLKEEFKRKTRICAGAFQTFAHIRFAFNPIRSPKIFFQFISHRFFRWVIGPVLLPLLFISCYLLFDNGAFYFWFFIGQLFFYALALLGLFLSLARINGGFIFIPLYFILMNGAVFSGFYRYITNRQSNLWTKSLRKSFDQTEI